MTRRVLFIQGGGENVHDQWDDKLAGSLERELGVGYSVLYPRMPDEANPGYAAWKAAILEQLDSLDDGDVVVGHSIGGTVLLHVLAEQPPMPKLGGMFFVAPPFVGDGGWSVDDFAPGADLSGRLRAGVPVFFYHAKDDDTVPVAHVHLYAKAIPTAVVRILEWGGHQFQDDLSEVARDIHNARGS
jgi:predicted alpha/beta hydrolase family esterase